MTDKRKLLTVTLNPAIDLACSVPGLALGQVNRVKTSRQDAGGKGVNIAALLTKFGVNVAATGFLGNDNAEIFEKHFKKEGIEDLFLRVDGATRTGIKILDPESQTTTDLNFPGLSPAASDIKNLFAAIRNELAETSVVIIAGSTPPGVDPSVIGELVTLIKENDVKVFVDTSGPALKSAIDAGPDFIKPNIDELKEYLGYEVQKEADILKEAQRLTLQGIETVVVSLGARGALFVERKEAVYATPPAIEAVSTVGAGDAVVGSMAAGMVMNLSLAERARLATAVSAAVVTQAGPNLPDLDDARKLEQQVVIHDAITSGGKDE